MIQDQMRDTADWEAWLALLAEHPGAEAEVTARLALQLLDDPRTVAEVCSAWAGGLGLPTTAGPLPGGPARFADRVWVAGAAAAAAALLASLPSLLPLGLPPSAPAPASPQPGADEAAVRGDPPGPLDPGVARIEADERPAGRAVVGSGLRPAVVALRSVWIRWSPPEGVDGAYYLIENGAPGPLLPVPTAGLQLQAPLPETVVLVAAPRGAADLRALPARVGDARSATSAMGAAQLLAIDLLSGGADSGQGWGDPDGGE